MSGRSMNSPAHKKETATIDSYAVQHCEHVSRRSFETVVAAFEAELTTVPSLPNLAAWNLRGSAAGADAKFVPLRAGRALP